ncbi:MAG: prolyl oligopeptidase family serine peptidase [Candidatus Acidiferrales bacterium]
MRFIEQKVAAYELMRFQQEPDRPRLPFDWGLEHLGGPANAPDDEARAFLDDYSRSAMTDSENFFGATRASDYELDSATELTFTSEIQSPCAEHNLVQAQFFPARRPGAARWGDAAVVVLAQWNARWEEQGDICRYLNRLGLAALKISLPYHDRRAVPGHPRADYLVSSNIGLTVQANRQAVLDVRRSLRWLELRGYSRLGILGTSIGSNLAYLTLAHEPALRAGAFLHVSTYFADVVAAGLTTSNVWEALEPHLALEDARRYWAPISPYPYVGRLASTRKKILTMSARYDPTFPYALTREFLEAMRREDISFDSLLLPCGHYSMGVAPFKYIVGARFGAFLFNSLA